MLFGFTEGSNDDCQRQNERRRMIVILVPFLVCCAVAQLYGGDAYGIYTQSNYQSQPQQYQQPQYQQYQGGSGYDQQNYPVRRQYDNYQLSPDEAPVYPSGNQNHDNPYIPHVKYPGQQYQYGGNPYQTKMTTNSAAAVSTKTAGPVVTTTTTGEFTTTTDASTTTTTAATTTTTTAAATTTTTEAIPTTIVVAV